MKNPRTNRLVVMLTDEERAVLDEMAARAHLPTSTLLRQMALRATERQRGAGHEKNEGRPS